MNDIDDTELQAYVDGRLDARRCADLEARLAAQPALAARVAAWREDARQLGEALRRATRPAAPQLDPAVIRRGLRRRRQRLALLCASWLLAVGLGVLGGWQGRGALARPAPMADAVEAYRVFASDRLRPVELRAGQGADLQAWLAGRLGRPLALPDLGTYGFALLGGRLLSTSEGAAALVFYESADGRRISFYVRPSRRQPEPSVGTRRDGPLTTRWWFHDGYGYAVVGAADDARTRAIQDALPDTI
ncbi:anti-sigma factor family protein [Solimonas flava]|uniref:anti-sigma factor family protein n=1 Tax=Solimonas flava TaxID=415849 RepID=UPI000428B60F|nr:anti-sigma factor [Solimonas flava]